MISERHKNKPFSGIKKDWTGLKHSDEAKNKMSNTRKEKGSHIGEKNSQYGTCWIYHDEKEKNKKIKKEELETYLNHGWVKGMKKLYNKNISK